MPRGRVLARFDFFEQAERLKREWEEKRQRGEKAGKFPHFQIRVLKLIRELRTSSPGKIAWALKREAQGENAEPLSRREITRVKGAIWHLRHFKKIPIPYTVAGEVYTHREIVVVNGKKVPLTPNERVLFDFSGQGAKWLTGKQIAEAGLTKSEWGSYALRSSLRRKLAAAGAKYEPPRETIALGDKKVTMSAEDAELFRIAKEGKLNFNEVASTMGLTKKELYSRLSYVRHRVGEAEVPRFSRKVAWEQVEAEIQKTNNYAQAARNLGVSFFTVRTLAKAHGLPPKTPYREEGKQLGVEYTPVHYNGVTYSLPPKEARILQAVSLAGTTNTGVISQLTGIPRHKVATGFVHLRARRNIPIRPAAEVPQGLNVELVKHKLNEFFAVRQAARPVPVAAQAVDPKAKKILQVLEEYKLKPTLQNVFDWVELDPALKEIKWDPKRYDVIARIFNKPASEVHDAYSEHIFQTGRRQEQRRNITSKIQKQRFNFENYRFQVLYRGLELHKVPTQIRELLLEDPAVRKALEEKKIAQ